MISSYIEFLVSSKVDAYLQGRGWTIADDGYIGMDLWENLETEEEIFVPTDKDAPDYSMLMEEFIIKLSKMESRDPLSLVRDIL